MTPLQIEMMLHYFVSPASPYAAHNPVTVSQRQQLVDAELLEVSGTPSGYRATPRGVAYVQRLCATPAHHNCRQHRIVGTVRPGDRAHCANCGAELVISLAGERAP